MIKDHEKNLEQFLLELENADNSWPNMNWVKVSGLNSIYILKLNRADLDSDTHLHYCGYVGVPKSHPYYDKIDCMGGNMFFREMESQLFTNESIDVDVHGGVTYTGGMDGWGKDYFFIGFDSAHMMDACTTEELKDFPFTSSFKPWSYMKEQVFNLYKQLEQVESNALISTSINKENGHVDNN